MEDFPTAEELKKHNGNDENKNEEGAAPSAGFGESNESQKNPENSTDAQKEKMVREAAEAFWKDFTAADNDYLKRILRRKFQAENLQEDELSAIVEGLAVDKDVILANVVKKITEELQNPAVTKSRYPEEKKGMLFHGDIVDNRVFQMLRDMVIERGAEFLKNRKTVEAEEPKKTYGLSEEESSATSEYQPRSPKTFDDVAREAGTKLTREQVERLKFLKGFIRRDYDECGELDFDLALELIQERKFVPSGKERPFAEYIIDSVGREKKEADEYAKKKKAYEDMQRQEQGKKEDSKKKSASAADEEYRKKTEENLKMWEEIMKKQREKDQEKAKKEEHEKMEAAKAREEERIKKRKKEDKERILRERPDDIRRAAWMQMGLSAKEYADIINGAIGLDQFSVLRLMQKILGVTTNDKKELKSAYRQKVNDYHPDRSTGPSFTAEYELIAGEKMKIVQNFYEKLKKAGIAS